LGDFFASAMFHVEHGFWNGCYKSARQMRMILIWDLAGKKKTRLAFYVTGGLYRMGGLE